MGRWDDPPLHRAELIAAARGELELDLVLAGVRYVNVFTGEVYDADVGIFGGRIAHVEPRPGTLAGREVLDRSGLWAIPGLIDPHVLANVAGREGVRYLLDASADSPLRTLVMAPSCVPSAPGVETAGA